MAFLSLGVVIVAQLIKTPTKMGGLACQTVKKQERENVEETPNFLTVEEEIYLVIL